MIENANTPRKSQKDFCCYKQFKLFLTIPPDLSGQASSNDMHPLIGNKGNYHDRTSLNKDWGMITNLKHISNNKRDCQNTSKKDQQAMMNQDV